MFFLVPKVDSSGAWFDGFESKTTKSVNLEVTSRCNLRCTYCTVSQPDYVGHDMDEGHEARICEELKPRNVEMVCLNGHGETTMIPGWPDRLKGFIDAFPVGMTSNFSRPLTDPELRAFARFKSVNMSLDSADSKVMREVRRRVGLDVMLDNLERLRATAREMGVKGPDVYLFVTVYDRNVLELEALARLAVSLRVTGVQFVTLMKHPDVEGSGNVRPVNSLDAADRGRAAIAIEAALRILKGAGITVETWGSSIDMIRRSVDAEASAGVEYADPEAIRRKLESTGGGNLHWHDSVIEMCGPDETRDCVDPWVFAQFEANGNVLPCCIHTPIGSTGKGRPVDVVLNDAPVRRLRHQMLTGELDPECAICPTRRRTGRDTFRRKYVQFLVLTHSVPPPEDSMWLKALKHIYLGAPAAPLPARLAARALRRGLTPALLNRLILRTDPGVSPALRSRVQFEGVSVGHFGLGDRIYLHPNAVGAEPASVRFRGVPLPKCLQADLHVYRDNPESEPVQFEMALVDSAGRTVHEESLVLGDAMAHWVLALPGLEGDHDVVFRTRMAKGSRSNQGAWAYVGYPIFTS
jgi:MoaA/NifB/PqqE/SkfB family radical SAM enzyme